MRIRLQTIHDGDQASTANAQKEKYAPENGGLKATRPEICSRQEAARRCQSPSFITYE